MRVKFLEVVGELTSLPGCGQVGVSHGVFVPEKIRGMGAGKLANELRTKYMKQTLGYDYALCTVDATNIAQIKILADNNWTRLDGFVSTKTGHSVELWGKQLNV